jgi:hypothetical protein
LREQLIHLLTEAAEVEHNLHSRSVNNLLVLVAGSPHCERLLELSEIHSGVVGGAGNPIPAGS